MSAGWEAPVADPGTVTSAVSATPTTGAAHGRPGDRRRQDGVEAIEGRGGRVRRGSDGLRQPADRDLEGPGGDPGPAAGAAEDVKRFYGWGRERNQRAAGIPFGWAASGF